MNTFLKSVLTLPFLGLVACAPPNLAEYEPVLDTFTSNMDNYEIDILQCRSIASDAKLKYERAAAEAAVTNIFVGTLVGAAVGSAVGSGSGSQGDYTRYGAAAGMASGAGAATNEQLIARYGPNKIVDRCMANRGYSVLNDVGAGTN